MNFFKSVQLLSFVAISFFSVDVYGCCCYSLQNEFVEVELSKSVELARNKAQAIEGVEVVMNEPGITTINASIIEAFNIDAFDVHHEDVLAQKIDPHHREIYCCCCTVLGYEDEMRARTMVGGEENYGLICMANLESCCRRTVQPEVEME